MSNTTEALQQGQDTMTHNLDRTVSGLKDGVAQATAGFEQAQSTMRQGMEKAMKTAQDMMSFSQGNIEAISRSGQIFAAGMQDIMQSLVSTSKSSMDDAVSTMKQVSAAKSVREAMELQGSLLRASLEKAVAQTTQLTDSTMKLSERTLAPISARLALATETFGRAG